MARTELLAALAAADARGLPERIALPLRAPQWIGGAPPAPFCFGSAGDPPAVARLLRPGEHCADAPFIATHLAPEVAAYRLSQALQARLDVWIHGCMLQVAHTGVLLLGPAGAGKSLTALELLDRGHGLIADDVVRLRAAGNQRIAGSCPDNARGALSLRSLGTFPVAEYFAMHTAAAEPVIELIVELDASAAGDPLTGGWCTTGLAGQAFTGLRLRPERNVALTLEMAVRMLRKGETRRRTGERLAGGVSCAW